MIVAAIVAAVLGALSGCALWAWARRRREDARLDEIARAGMSRERYPAMYVGPDTVYGLRQGTPCRRLRGEYGLVTRIRTPDGRDWNVPRDHVASRPGPPPAPDARRRRQVAPKGEVYR